MGAYDNFLMTRWRVSASPGAGWHGGVDEVVVITHGKG